MKFIGKIVSIIFLFFGVLFIWGAFSPNGSTGWIVVGIITVGICLAIGYFVFRKPQVVQQQTQNVTLQIDLPGDVKMEGMKCNSCGGALAPENITMVAGAPVVTCPYCHTSYQLTEEPKW
jgi:hypothetical protein